LKWVRKKKNLLHLQTEYKPGLFTFVEQSPVITFVACPAGDDSLPPHLNFVSFVRPADRNAIRSE
jgi:hypothetical protein